MQQCAFHVPKEWFALKPHHFPKEMLLDLAAVLVGSTSGVAKASIAAMEKTSCYGRDMTLFEVPESDEDEDVDVCHAIIVDINIY